MQHLAAYDSAPHPTAAYTTRQRNSDAALRCLPRSIAARHSMMRNVFPRHRGRQRAAAHASVSQPRQLIAYGRKRHSVKCLDPCCSLSQDDEVGECHDLWQRKPSHTAQQQVAAYRSTSQHAAVRSSVPQYVSQHGAADGNACAYYRETPHIAVRWAHSICQRAVHQAAHLGMSQHMA